MAQGISCSYQVKIDPGRIPQSVSLEDREETFPVHHVIGASFLEVSYVLFQAGHSGLDAGVGCLDAGVGCLLASKLPLHIREPLQEPEAPGVANCNSFRVIADRELVWLRTGLEGRRGSVD